MKKGRHRRFEEARALKRSFSGDLSRVLDDDDEEVTLPTEPCEECDAAPGAAHASWCMAAEDDPYADLDDTA